MHWTQSTKDGGDAEAGGLLSSSSTELSLPTSPAGLVGTVSRLPHLPMPLRPADQLCLRYPPHSLSPGFLPIPP